MAQLAADYCIPLTNICRTMAEWGVFWQAFTAIAAFLFGYAGYRKIKVELVRINEQRTKEAADREDAERLRRTQFFLDQHRRLFDDKELSEVLCFLDGDDSALASPGMADKKRKLLTFLEEIALLVQSDQIKEDVAFYMFGYYARCAVEGKNFSEHIDMSPAHWGLLFSFVERYYLFEIRNLSGPTKQLML